MRPRVLKFGGTSVGSAEPLASALAIAAAASREAPLVVVVSALAGVTDQLELALSWAAGGQPFFRPWLSGLRQRHRALLWQVAGRAGVEAAEAKLDRELARLYQALEGVVAAGAVAPAARDRVLATGERLAVPVFVAGLTRRGIAARGVDAGALIRTDSCFGEATVDLARSRRQVLARLPLPGGAVAVVPGFLAADGTGRTTTLGRGGSDYSAALLGAALAAERVEIWTDVDGLLSADPKLLPGARRLAELSYDEAAELAYYGAKVLHRKVVQPLVEGAIPLWIRNTWRPADHGTWVRSAALPAEDGSTGGGGARAVAALPRVSLLAPGGRSGWFDRWFTGRAAELAPLYRLGPSSSLLAAPPELADRLEAELPAAGTPAGPFGRRDGFALVAAVGRGWRPGAGEVAALGLALAAAGVLPEVLGPGPAAGTLLGLVPAGELARTVVVFHQQLVLSRRRPAAVPAPQLEVNHAHP